MSKASKHLMHESGLQPVTVVMDKNEEAPLGESDQNDAQTPMANKKLFLF